MACVMTFIQSGKNQEAITWNQLPYNISEEVKKHIENTNLDLKNPLMHLMSEINSSLFDYRLSLSQYSIYTSVMLVDKDRNIITRTGNMLFIRRSEEQEQEWYHSIPLDLYFNDEQKKLFFEDICSGAEGNFISVSGEVYGFIDGLRITPQTILLQSELNKQPVTFHFEFFPGEQSQLFHYSGDRIELFYDNFERDMKPPSKAYQKKLDECDRLALEQLEVVYEEDSPSSGRDRARGSSSLTKVWNAYSQEFIINDEPYRLVFYSQGNPLKITILELLPLYIFLFFVVLVLIRIVSKCIIMDFQKKINPNSEEHQIY